MFSFLRRNVHHALLIILLVLFHSSVLAQDAYYPPEGYEWEEKSPAELGFEQTAFQRTVDFAREHENDVKKDLRVAILEAFRREPFHEIVGPTKERGEPAGMIIKDGYIAAKWGDLKRVDMTFSVTKSYLSTVAGLAWDRGLIRNLDDKVREYVWDGTFKGEHNAKISWHHLLNQSSDWSGRLFGMYDWADRPPRKGDIDDWRNRKMRKPGTHFEYNDVRVNVLAYSLLQVWREPLPQILKEKIMDPIDASTTWRWYGYKNSFVNVDGVKVQSVSGGGHSGGGMFINTYDQARFGLLFAREGQWKDHELISEEWIDRAITPSDPNPRYGYMWWLAAGQKKWENVPDRLYYAAGFGGNYIVVDEKNDIVVVLRWFDGSKLNELLARLYQSLSN